MRGLYLEASFILEVINIFNVKTTAIYIKDAMQPRANKDSDFVIRVAINLASNVSLMSAEKMMIDSGISKTIIERILYVPNNIRKTDLNNFSSC